MPIFNNGEAGLSVRGKINTAITAVDTLNTGDNLLLTAAERAKLAGVEAGATGDQTAGEIASLVQDWRGVGNETLLVATAALEAAASSGVSDGVKGQITVSGAGSVWTINDGIVTNAKLSTMNDSTIKGRAVGAGSGAPTDLTPAQARAILNVEDGATADQTASEIASMQQNWRSAGTETLIAATVALQAAAASGVPDGDKGDVVVTGLGTTWTVDADTITNTKMANMAALSVKANPANSVSDPVDVQAAVDGQAFVRSGTSLVFGQIQTAGLADSAVTNAKLSTVSTATLKGRITAGVGAVEDLTPTQARSILNVADGANAYTHPNHSGDVTSTGDGATLISNNAVSNAKLADMPANTFKVRADSSSGDPSDLALSTSQLAGRGSTGNVAAITIGDGLSMVGTVLSVGGTISATKDVPTGADKVPMFNAAASDATVITTVQGIRGNQDIGSALATTGTINLDVTALAGRLETITLTGNPTFTTSNRVSGKWFELRLDAGASPRTIVWPVGWVSFGAALPVSLDANKVMAVMVRCLGVNDTNIDATVTVSA